MYNKQNEFRGCLEEGQWQDYCSICGTMKDVVQDVIQDK